MFNFSLFIFLITFLFLAVATFYDVKKRIIPNFLILYFLILAILIKVIQAFALASYNIILNALLSFVITFVVSYILWETGFFAGGDLKLFIVVSILNPFNLNFLNFANLFGIISKPVFALTLILASILVTAPLLIIHSLYLFIFRKHHFILIDILKSKNTLFSFLSSVLVLYFISSFLHIFSLTIPFLFYFLFSIIFLLFFRQLEKFSLKYFYYVISIFYVLLIFYEIISEKNIFSLLNLLTIIITIKVLFMLITIYKIISTRILVESKKISTLQEGDVLKNNIYLIKGKIIEKEVSFLSFIKLTVTNNYSKDLIIDSKKVGGLTPKDITFLKTTYKDNLEKEVLLKRTLPFTPSVLIAYIVLNIFGDVIWFLF